MLSLLFVAAVSVLNLAGADPVGGDRRPAHPHRRVRRASALFAMFWLAQTAQKWDEVDPSLI